MKCKVDHNHRTEIEIQDADSPHYAALVCGDCRPALWLKWLSREEAEYLEEGDSVRMEELREVAQEASEDVRGADTERTYRVDDVVWYYLKAGEIHKGEIMHWNSDNTYDLYHGDRNYKAADLYPTKEEAEKALSPAGRRMAGCLREAALVFDACFPVDWLTDQRAEKILKIAFQLFNTTED